MNLTEQNEAVMTLQSQRSLLMENGHHVQDVFKVHVPIIGLGRTKCVANPISHWVESQTREIKN